MNTDDNQDESERFLYFKARHTDKIKNADGTLKNPDENRGTYLISVIKVLQTIGSCWEISCPYDAGPLAAPSDRVSGKGSKKHDRLCVQAECHRR